MSNAKKTKSSALKKTQSPVQIVKLALSTYQAKWDELVELGPMAIGLTAEEASTNLSELRETRAQELIDASRARAQELALIAAPLAQIVLPAAMAGRLSFLDNLIGEARKAGLGDAWISAIDRCLGWGSDSDGKAVGFATILCLGAPIAPIKLGQSDSGQTLHLDFEAFLPESLSPSFFAKALRVPENDVFVHPAPASLRKIEGGTSHLVASVSAYGLAMAAFDIEQADRPNLCLGWLGGTKPCEASAAHEFGDSAWMGVRVAVKIDPAAQAQFPRLMDRPSTDLLAFDFDAPSNCIADALAIAASESDEALSFDASCLLSGKACPLRFALAGAEGAFAACRRSADLEIQSASDAIQASSATSLSRSRVAMLADTSMLGMNLAPGQQRLLLVSMCDQANPANDAGFGLPIFSDSHASLLVDAIADLGLMAFECEAGEETREACGFSFQRVSRREDPLSDEQGMILFETPSGARPLAHPYDAQTIGLGTQIEQALAEMGSGSIENELPMAIENSPSATDAPSP